MQKWQHCRLQKIKMYDLQTRFDDAFDKTLSSLPQITFSFSLKDNALVLVLNCIKQLLKYQEKQLLSILSTKSLYILWIKEKSWLIKESPDLRGSNCFEGIKLFSITNFHKLEAMRLVCNFSNIVYPLSYKLGLNWLFPF